MEEADRSGAVDSSEILRPSERETELEGQLASLRREVEVLRQQLELATLRPRDVVDPGAKSPPRLPDAPLGWADERKALLRRANKAEEELRLVKALLLLKNVDVDVELDGDGAKEGGGAGSSARAGGADAGSDAPDTGPERVTLHGSPKRLGELMLLRNKIKVRSVLRGTLQPVPHPTPPQPITPRLLPKLLRHSCFLLRAEVSYLQQAIPETARWVSETARGALESEGASAGGLCCCGPAGEGNSPLWGSSLLRAASEAAPEPAGAPRQAGQAVLVAQSSRRAL